MGVHVCNFAVGEEKQVGAILQNRTTDYATRCRSGVGKEI